MTIRCVELTLKSRRSELEACLEVLADVARDRGLPAAGDGPEAFLRRALEPGSTARLLLLLDEKAWPAGLCLFHALTELEGPRLWVSEFYIRYDDHANELKAARVLASALVSWAKSHGCASMGGTAESGDIEMRELARLLRMDARRMVLLSRAV